MMNAHIYLVANTINNKHYIGQTIVYKNKFGHGLALQDAYNKHGKDKFTYERLCSNILNRNTLNYLEKFWIATFNSIAPNGYNIEHGGSDKGEVSESTKQKLRDANIGKKASVETKQKISDANRGENNSFYGKTHSTEAIAKIIAANLGRTFVTSEETKKKIGQANAGENNGMFGKKHTDEVKLNFKDRAKARHWLGKKFSDEHKAHLSIERTCPHCSKVGKGNAMIRHHMDNCKQNRAVI